MRTSGSSLPPTPEAAQALRLLQVQSETREPAPSE